MLPQASPSGGLVSVMPCTLTMRQQLAERATLGTVAAFKLEVVAELVMFKR